MAGLLQFAIAVVVGVVVGAIVKAFGVNDPWPIMLGVVAFCACLGITVFIFDGDAF